MTTSGGVPRDAPTTTKPYAGLMVTLLDRETGKENKVMLYPAVRVELMEMPLEPPNALATTRVFVPLDNMGADMMGWREEIGRVSGDAGGGEQK